MKCCPTGKILCIFWAIPVLFLSINACSHISSTDTPTGQTLTLNGITYDVPGTPYSYNTVGSEIHCYTDKVRLDVAHHHLAVNGIHYGDVREGDHIQIAPDGTVTINGRPQAKPSGAQ